jgi:nicotinate dehydrogenase subunit B
LSASTLSLEKQPAIDDWLAIETDGRVSVCSGKVDIGQRISTAIAIIAATELDVSFERIDLHPVDTTTSPDEGYTSASNSMQESGQAIRLACATARKVLVQLAAKALDVDQNVLDVTDGVVLSRTTNRSVTYFELMGGQKFNLPVDPSAVTKSATCYRKVQKSIKPLGLVELINGTTQFVHDMVVPNMLHARVIRPPNYHARLLRLDTSDSEQLGVQLVRNGSFLAVAGSDEYLTIKAAQRVANTAHWSRDRALAVENIYQSLVTNPRLSLPVKNGAAVEEPISAIGAPPQGTAFTLNGRFERPYLMHASIGPSAALAHFDHGYLTIWTHSQGIYPLRATLAEALNLSLTSVRLIHRLGPGCYGHNGADDAALDAALIAMAIPNRPVLLKWTREDEHAWEPYGPCMVVEIRACLDAKGNVSDWSHETYSDTHRTRPRPGPNKVGPSRLLAMQHLEHPLEEQIPEPALSAPLAGVHRNADPIYSFPNPRVIKHLVRDMPLRTSTLRSLGAYTNILAIESIMDELAISSNTDPLVFRLRHLDDDRAKAVITAAADHARWRQKPRRTGFGQGLAFARYNNLKAYAAVVVELEVDDLAQVKLVSAVIAVDAGQIVDPDGVRLQIEGGFLQSASWTLYEEVKFDEQGITSRDWDSYPILRFDNIPEIDIVLMDRPDEPWVGPSEASIGPTAGAIANAIFDATGLRLRHLPFSPDQIRYNALQ